MYVSYCIYYILTTLEAELEKTVNITNFFEFHTNKLYACIFYEIKIAYGKIQHIHAECFNASIFRRTLYATYETHRSIQMI